MSMASVLETPTFSQIVLAISAFLITRPPLWKSRSSCQWSSPNFSTPCFGKPYRSESKMSRISMGCYCHVKRRLAEVFSAHGKITGKGPSYILLNSLYSMLSAKACQLASIIFSETPTVDHFSLWSPDSINTRTLEPVPRLPDNTRTL